jgi:membrane protein implicated in regulation of membrane protease activity
MAESTLWWLAAGALIALELLTGTFYLLLISSGLVTAALLAHVGTPQAWQWAGAAIVGGGSVLVWQVYRRSRPTEKLANANADVNLDIGETVHVDHWQDDNTCSIKYRGAHWDASLQQGQARQSGTYVIDQVIGNRLFLKKPD